jgi:hypothetical protein
MGRPPTIGNWVVPLSLMSYSMHICCMNGRTLATRRSDSVCEGTMLVGACLGVAVVQQNKVIYNVGEQATGGVEWINVLSRDRVQRDLIEHHRSSRSVHVDGIDAAVSVRGVKYRGRR